MNVIEMAHRHYDTDRNKKVEKTYKEILPSIQTFDFSRHKTFRIRRTNDEERMEGGWNNLVVQL